MKTLMLSKTSQKKNQSVGKCSWHWLMMNSLYFSFLFTALTLLIVWQEGHPACKKTVCWVCWWWHCDWSFARLIAPVVTTACITLGYNKSQNGDILVPANQGPPGKWQLNWKESLLQCFDTVCWASGRTSMSSSLSKLFQQMFSTGRLWWTQSSPE